MEKERKTENDIELRSEEFQEVLGRMLLKMFLHY